MKDKVTKLELDNYLDDEADSLITRLDEIINKNRK